MRNQKTEDREQRTEKNKKSLVRWCPGVVVTWCILLTLFLVELLLLPQATQVAAAPVCGDGTCDSTETCSTCPGDCGECAGPEFPQDYVSWWKFDGNANDETGTNNGTFNGNATTVYDSERDYSTETNGYVLSLDGAGDYVSATVPQLTFNDGDEYTISAWFTANKNSEWQTIFAKSYRVGHFNQTGVAFLVLSTNAYSELYVGSKQIRYDPNIVPGTWYHVVATMNSSKNVSLYMNGAFVGSAVVSENLSNGNNQWFGIGKEIEYNAHYHNGTIDDVMIFNRSLSAEEIQQIYNAQKYLCTGLTKCSDYTDSDSCVNDVCTTGLDCEWDGANCSVIGDTWYVRPAGGIYGSENGGSYDNAWDGLKSVVWGPDGVNAGDTLYVCGLHLWPETPPGTEARNWEIGASGTGEDSRITIRGDYPGDQGIIWGVDTQAGPSRQWTYEGDNVYSVVTGNYNDFFFQDVTATNWTILSKVSSLQECKDTPGSYYSETYSYPDTLYVHCTDGGNPDGRIVGGANGWHIGIVGQQYITFKNSDFYMPYFSSINFSYIKWEGCKLWYNHLVIRDGCHHMELIDCDIAHSKGGLAVQDASAPYITDAPYNITIRGCKIHDIGVYPIKQNSDAEGIGVNGANYMLIENNEFYNVGSGITFYPYSSQTAVNNTIRWNWVHDTHSLGGANNRGIQFNHGASHDDVTGNKIYGNIVGPNVSSVGYRWNYEDVGEFYNNICYDCGTSFFFQHSLHGVRVKLRNMISLNPRYRHIEFYTDGTETEYSIDSDYNLFYPISGEQFYLQEYATGASQLLNFTGWQALSRTGSVFDPNSIAADPLFVSANPQVPADFKLQAGSPAIDNGTDVGLTQDYEGNIIPQGLGFDIGAYEYVPQGNILYGDVSGDSEISAYDAALTAQAAVELITLTAEQTKAADVNGDSEVSAYDAALIAQKAVGLIERFPVEG